MEAKYVLCDASNGTRTFYAFPVDLIPSEYSDISLGVLIDEEVPRFEITLDGIPLDYQIRQGFDADIYLDEYNNEQDIQRLYFTTLIEIQPLDTVELVVSYSFKARYEDFWFSKGFFTMYENRYFQYLMDPAGDWGDGTVDQLEITFDFSELLVNGGCIVDLPNGGIWVDETQYMISENDFDMASASPLKVTYDVSVWGVTDELLRVTENPKDLTVTASSFLPASGNCSYSPDNLIDGDLSTVWAENASGYDGEWIELLLDKPMAAMFVGIVCGYTKDQTTYTTNGRPRTVTVEMYSEDDVYSRTSTLEDIPWEEVEKGFLSPLVQHVYNSGNGIDDVYRIRLRFDDAYPGDTYDDLCVSELYVGGWRELGRK